MTLADLSTEQWVLALLGAICTGLGKGGLSGIGNLSVWLFAEAFGARASVGIALPVLICADIVAVLVYRRHTSWPHLLRLLPLLFAGLIIGYLVFDMIPNDMFGKMMGVLLLSMTILHFARRRFAKTTEAGSDAKPALPAWILWVSGLLGGISTMLANAAGPIISFYLLSAKMPKYVFIGTAAWLFLILNIAKIPLQAAVDNVDRHTMVISLCLGAIAALVALGTPLIIRVIPQKLFEILVWSAIVVAGLRLMF